jgi:hypothetical protein
MIFCSAFSPLPLLPVPMPREAERPIICGRLEEETCGVRNIYHILNLREKKEKNK